MSELLDRILGSNDAEARDIYIGGWDVTLQLRSLTVEQQRDIVARFPDDDAESTQIRGRELIAKVVHDPDTGAPVFADADEVKRLTTKNWAVYRELQDAVDAILSPNGSKEAVGKGSSG